MWPSLEEQNILFVWWQVFSPVLISKKLHETYYKQLVSSVLENQCKIQTALKSIMEKSHHSVKSFMIL
jgi:transcription termination factor NusB